MTTRLTRVLLAGCLAGGALTLAAMPATAAGTAKSRGLVVTYFWFANHQGDDDCPEGAALGMRRLAAPYLEKMSAKDRADLLAPGHEQKLAAVLAAFALGGTAYGGATDVRDQMFGPTLNPENAKKRPMGFGVTPVQDQCNHPEQFEDPPLKVSQGKVAFGLDLDGTDGSGPAAANTCRHQNFTGVDGSAGIDNQYYRVLACVDGYRRKASEQSASSVSAGTMEDWFHGNRKDGATTMLIELNGVDDAVNDDEVEVRIYSSRQATPYDATGLKGVPSFSLTALKPGDNPHNRAKGRIKDGVLTTDPVELWVPTKPAGGEDSFYEFRDARLRLELTADGGAKGLMAGYFDVEKAYTMEMRSYGDTARRNSVYDGSCPAIYAAMKKLADGYPDAKTGQCTAISTAFKVEAVKAFVIHPAEQKTAQAN